MSAQFEELVKLKIMDIAFKFRLIDVSIKTSASTESDYNISGDVIK